MSSASAENPSDETFLLPASVGEETLTWYVPKKSDGLKVFVFGNLLVVLFYLSYEDRKFQKNRQRERELAADYPDIVYRMILLVSSGMTVRGAWGKDGAGLLPMAS